MKKGAAVDFVPFEPAVSIPNPDAGPRLKVLTKTGGGDTPTDFNPLNTASAASPTTPGHATHGAGGGTPVITLQRDGDRISLIRVECCCGQVIELNCTYSNP